MGSGKWLVVVCALAALWGMSGCASTPRPEAVNFGTGAKKPRIEVESLEKPRTVFAAHQHSGETLRYWPVQYRNRQVISGYGPRGRGFHNGLDIKAPHSSPVLAVAGGRVVYSGQQRGYGKVIMVDHGDGFMTTYAHLHSKDVSEGDVVAEGQAIGTVGTTGNATTPHVHFEVRHEGKPIDPSLFLSQ